MQGVTDMKEEKELFQKIGKENPFKVPEGYFENLTQQVMERLPEKEPQPTQEISMWERVKPWVYMAAMFVGLMFTVQVFVGKQEQQAGPAEYVSPVSDLSDEYLAPIINQTMLDDYELYQYLSDADKSIYN